MKSPSRLSLALLGVVVIGCSDSNGFAPTAPRPPASPSPTRHSISTRIAGTAIDADTGQPVVDARVRVALIRLDGSPASIGDPSWNAVTDGSGRFEFTADLPAGWRWIVLEGKTDTHEMRQQHFERANVSTAELQLFSLLSIQPGQSLKTRLYGVAPTCFGEDWPCRRLFVDAPAGDLVEIEIIALDERATVGVEVSTNRFAPVFSNRVTVPRGDVWIYGGMPVGNPEVLVSATRR